MRVDIRNVSMKLGKFFAQVFWVINWGIVYLIKAIIKVFRLLSRQDDYEKKFDYEKVLCNIYNIENSIFEFIWRCIVWFLVNVVGGLAIGVGIYVIGFIGLIFSFIINANTIPVRIRRW